MSASATQGGHNQTSIDGGGAYWAERATARSLFVPNKQALLLAVPLFWGPGQG